MASNLSLGSDAAGHQVFAGSPNARQRPSGPGRQGPYPGGYAAPPQGGCGIRCRFPVAFRRPGVSFSRHPVPAAELKPSLQSAYPAIFAWTSTGLPRFAGARHDRGGLLLYPGVAVSSRPTGRSRPAPAAFQRPTLHPRPCIPPQKEAVTRHQRRFTLLTRPIFPLPVTPGWSGESFGFPLGFTPRHYWQRMPGWEQVSRTLTRDYTFDTNRTSNSESTHNLRLRAALPSLPRDRRCPHGPRPVRVPPPAAFLRHGSCTPVQHHLPGASCNEASTRVHSVHPPGLPLTRRPRMTRRRLRLLPRAPHPRRQDPRTHAGAGTGYEH